MVKNLRIGYSSVLDHACAELPYIFPKLETLSIRSLGEMVNAPMVPNTFLHLKYLCITLSAVTLSPSYDYLSLVSFLDACHSLDTFIVDVSARHPENDSIYENPSHLRQLPEQRHDNLRNVKITGFRSAKSLFELTYHILENTSVECLTMDTSFESFRCSPGKPGRCLQMSKDDLMEASKALFAIKAYIEGKVPSTVSAKHSEGDSIYVNPTDLRQLLPEQRHDNIRDVKITGFHSAKTLVELTYHILRNTSVECLTLDTTSNPFRCSPGKTGRCSRMSKDALVEAPKALFAIIPYIEGKFPLRLN
uniref:At1g61320/AtMIF1 LRR domain-containing protein n=1 Tax=Oryza punctata TaxID=4537 RepID=A0A0E0M383_ORYPU